MTEWQWVVAVAGAGAGSYALRVTPFAFSRLRELGRRYLRCLTYISFAVAAGIISRAIFLDGGQLELGRGAWVKALAVVVAVVLFRRTRNMPVALFSAVAVAVAVQWTLGQLAPAS